MWSSPREFKGLDPSYALSQKAVQDICQIGEEERKLPCGIGKHWRLGPTSQSGTTLVCAANPCMMRALTLPQFTLYLLKIYPVQLK